jgi:hypothetical protein
MGRGGRPRAHHRSRPADITPLTCPAIDGAARAHGRTDDDVPNRPLCVTPRPKNPHRWATHSGSACGYPGDFALAAWPAGNCPMRDRPTVFLYIDPLGANIRICRMSRAFDQSLLACQLRHAGAQAVDVPVGRPEVSLVQVPSDSGSPSSSAPPRASSASPDPGRPPRAAGRCCRRGCGRTRRSGGWGRIAGSCRRSRR